MLPNPKGSRRDYVEGFSLTDAEYQLIREELSPESRKFLVKQGHDSVVVELDLTGLDDELAVLSGRADTNIPVIAIRAIAFYVLGFFFFLQIPGLAAGLGGGGASLATQFANAATGNFAPSAGRALSSAPGRLAGLPFARAGEARQMRLMGGAGGSGSRGSLTRTNY